MSEALEIIAGMMIVTLAIIASIMLFVIALGVYAAFAALIVYLLSVGGFVAFNTVNVAIGFGVLLILSILFA